MLDLFAIVRSVAVSSVNREDVVTYHYRCEQEVQRENYLSIFMVFIFYL